jgi:hypothetical protein
MLHAVGSGANEHNAKGQCRDALLELDAAVHRDEASEWPFIRRGSSPFLIPLQPRPETVSTA